VPDGKSNSKKSGQRVGRADHSLGDFVEDVKRPCAHDVVPFENDILNELVPVT
jgi:hypothetical protein